MGLFHRTPRANDAFTDDAPEGGGYPVVDRHGNVSSWHTTKADADAAADKLEAAMHAGDRPDN
jgi:hypothetical protein